MWTTGVVSVTGVNLVPLDLFGNIRFVSNRVDLLDNDVFVLLPRTLLGVQRRWLL